MEKIVYCLGIILIIVVIVVRWRDWFIIPKRKRIWKNKLKPYCMKQVKDTITYAIPKFNLITWLNSHEAREAYLISEEEFLDSFTKKMSEEVEKYRLNEEEKLEAKLNTAYYEYQSRNRKNTE